VLLFLCCYSYHMCQNISLMEGKIILAREHEVMMLTLRLYGYTVIYLSASLCIHFYFEFTLVSRRFCVSLYCFMFLCNIVDIHRRLLYYCTDVMLLPYVFYVALSWNSYCSWIRLCALLLISNSCVNVPL